MSDGKGIPSSLGRWDRTSELHQQFASSSVLPSQATAGFRTSTEGPEEAEIDSDYGRFASTSSAARTAVLPSEFAGTWSGTEERQQVDGGDVMALLSSGGVGEGVYGDWEQVLQADQYRKREINDARPLDPPATTFNSTRNVSSGEAQLANHDSTTTDEELISSLSSLDLSARSYLRTLLALPAETSIMDYLHQNRYTEDVYALPKEVRKVLEEAEQQPGVSAEAGRAKAVRRLEMVLQHLSINEESLAATLPSTSTFPHAAQPSFPVSTRSLPRPIQPPLSRARPPPVDTTSSPIPQNWSGDDYSAIAAQHTYRRRPEQRLPSGAGNDRENSVGGDVADSAGGNRSPLSDSLQRRMNGSNR